MSREAEARSGILGEKAREESVTPPEELTGLPAWPMTSDQWAWARSTVDQGAYRAFAWWLRERVAAGLHRFSLKDLPFDMLGANPQRMQDIGLLRRHEYSSGAWQFEITPFTRSWFMFVITTTPKDSPCPSSPSTPKPADSTPGPTRS